MPSEYKVTAPNGLGDALHLRAIILHLLKDNKPIKVYTKWPDIFTDLPVEILSAESTRTVEGMRSSASCIFCQNYTVKCLDIFTMSCRQIGLTEEIDFEIDWKVRNPDLLDKIRKLAQGRKIFIYQPPKRSITVEQNTMIPGMEDFNKVVMEHEDYYRIKLGHTDYIINYRTAPCELDLIGKTSVSDLLDIGTIGDLFFSVPSYIVIMGEAFNKNYICMFTNKALSSAYSRASNITPERYFHKKHLGTAVIV